MQGDHGSIDPRHPGGQGSYEVQVAYGVKGVPWVSADPQETPKRKRTVPQPTSNHTHGPTLLPGIAVTTKRLNPQIPLPRNSIESNKNCGRNSICVSSRYNSHSLFLNSLPILPQESQTNAL